VNGWLAPFVLNQPDLNFGRRAMLDTVREVPFGTLSVCALAALVAIVMRHQYRVIADGLNATGSWLQQLSGDGVYLLLVFVAAGLALYYESFLYSQMIIPLLLVFVLRALRPLRSGVLLMWMVSAVWGINSAQQILTFRRALGL